MKKIRLIKIDKNSRCFERIAYDIPLSESKQYKEVGMKKKVKKVPVEVYSRVVGYYRPVQNWNKGKKEEFKERESFNVTGSVKE